MQVLALDADELSGSGYVMERDWGAWRVLQLPDPYENKSEHQERKSSHDKVIGIR
jgi:hypothetical protein